MYYGYLLHFKGKLHVHDLSQKGGIVFLKKIAKNKRKKEKILFFFLKKNPPAAWGDESVPTRSHHQRKVLPSRTPFSISQLN